MPVALDQLSGKIRPLAVDLGDGDVINIQYKPSVYTAEFESAVQKKAAANDVDAVGDAVASVLVGWDVFEDTKQTKKVPLTATRLRSFPLYILATISSAIGDDLRPNRRNGTRSDGGSLA